MKKPIGYISYTHGLDGKVKIVPMVSIEEFRENVNKTIIFYQADKDWKTIKITIFAFTGKVFLCKIENIKTIEEAKKILKKEIFIETNNEDYLNPHDILGFTVVLPDEQKKYGEVVDYGNYGSGDLIEIKKNNSNKREFYRCTKEDILDIDYEQRQITILKRNEY